MKEENSTSDCISVIVKLASAKRQSSSFPHTFRSEEDVSGRACVRPREAPFQNVSHTSFCESRGERSRGEEGRERGEQGGATCNAFPE